MKRSLKETESQASVDLHFKQYERLLSLVEKTLEQSEKNQKEVQELKQLISGDSVSTKTKRNTGGEELKVYTKTTFQELINQNLNDDNLNDLLRTNCEDFYKIRKDILIKGWLQAKKQKINTAIDYTTDWLIELRGKEFDTWQCINVDVPEMDIDSATGTYATLVMNNMRAKRAQRIFGQKIMEKDQDNKHRIGFREFITAAWDSLKFIYFGKVLLFLKFLFC